MPQPSPIGKRIRWFTGTLLAVGLLVLGPWPFATGQKQKAKEPPARAPMAPRLAPVSSELWKSAPLTPAQPAEIDQLIARELQQDRITPAPLTTDEQFIRRVTLDLTGELPMPADVDEFVADRDAGKRAKLIDRLLASDEYARYWARYWKDVILTRLTDIRAMTLARSFESWMVQQLKENRSWSSIARAMITAEGGCRFEDDGKQGAIFFLAAHLGPDSANERAAETARVFLGIQIQCAQCHNHPFDEWKQVQFHELAGYFARVRERPMREPGRPIPIGMELFGTPRGEHTMPGKTTVTDPRFLDGKSPGKDLGDKQRRQALADAIVDRDNPWFAAAYANRMWGELLGQSFYAPVDDMGPRKEAVLGSVLARLASSFRATDHDTRALLRLILNTQAYQRQIRLSEPGAQHLQFAAAYPTRLRADALWESLVGVLGRINQQGPARPGPFAGGPFGQRPGLEGEFKREFEFDPSLKAEDVEGSIPQALLMMNNPIINQRIEARGTNLLGRILTAYPQDDDALRMVYLRTLARKPTTREKEKCLSFIKKTGNRAEAFEDILWALLNSTEFQTKR